MTDQFSPEYRTFLQGEGKVLQEYWDKDNMLGYWVWNAEIQAQHLVRDHYDIGEADVWLPTLFDLIQIIEGAGWRWCAESTSKVGGPYTKYTVYAEKESDDSVICMDEWAEGDLLLTAARLAVKAVEGKG